MISYMVDFGNIFRGHRAIGGKRDHILRFISQNSKSYKRWGFTVNSTHPKNSSIQKDVL